MAASYDTVYEIIAILRRHCTQEQMQRIIADLLEVDGNASFRETVRRIAQSFGVTA